MDISRDPGTRICLEKGKAKEKKVEQREVKVEVFTGCHSSYWRGNYHH